MSSSNSDDEKKTGLLSQIIPTVIIAILVGGTSPWWYKEFIKPDPSLSPTSLPSPTLPSPSTTPLNSNPAIISRWFNSALNQNSAIIQEGNRFRFTTWGAVQGDSFMSSGSGTITGRNFESSYIAQYVSGRQSKGECSGTISSDGTRMTSTCNDSIWGTFVSDALRQ